MKHRDLARRIAELTEDLEKLRTQKNMVLNWLDCSDDSIVTVRRDIATMEAGLQKLEQQERQYSAELGTVKIREWITHSMILQKPLFFQITLYHISVK